MPAPDKLRIEMANALQTPAGYAELLQELKTRIHAAQVRAAFAVSRELILLYWSIGREILTRFDAQGWGARLSSGWHMTCKLSSPASRVSAREISST
jgi:hypothetical protein